MDFCTLCKSVNETYNSQKVIPRDASAPPYDPTCEEYATLDRYISEVDTVGVCSVTERSRARAWCECAGEQPSCALTCDDGNPPPDLTKVDPVLSESCARFVYEYSTLTEEECKTPDVALNFDAKAFCCNEPQPDNCSICPTGQKLGDPAKEVKTEFFGIATCGDINTYAGYLPADSCAAFINKLLDNPFGAEGECCVASSSSDPYVTSTHQFRFFFVSLLLVGVSSFL